ncbi:MAG: hypothetical protein WCD11_15465, partial [Solirubrobacteraceae bacterium]
MSMTVSSPVRVGLLALLLGVLFAAALLVAKAGGTSTSTPGPVGLSAPAASVAVTAPPATSALPALRPKPQPPKPKHTASTATSSTGSSAPSSSTSSAPPV